MNPTRHRHVLGDWGTSRLRLFLIDDGSVVDRCDGPGINALTAGPIDTLTGLIAPWFAATARPVEVTLSGMVGSRNGLVEVPYATAPADRDAWSQVAWSATMRGVQLTIGAGLKDVGRGVAEVMRGEETQIFGAIELDRQLGVGTHLIVLPGTHSKWVEMRDGTVTRFRTALTGELYALLRDHSILLKAGTASSDADADTQAGFAAGVLRSAQLGGGLLAALFQTRTAQLLEQRSREWAAGFLSGLLIAHEIAGLGNEYPTLDTVWLIGDTHLASLYQRAFSARAVQARALDGTACAIAGLRHLHHLTRNPSP